LAGNRPEGLINPLFSKKKFYLLKSKIDDFIQKKHTPQKGPFWWGGYNLNCELILK
jgi:hypothetical protein